MTLASTTLPRVVQIRRIQEFLRQHQLPGKHLYATSNLRVAANLNLDLSDTGIADLSPLQGFDCLRMLDISRTPVESITPLAGMTGLSELRMRELHAFDGDLSVIGGLVSLTRLNLSGTACTSIDRLGVSSSLRSIDLSNTGICEFESLKGLGLRTLDISNLDSVTDQSFESLGTLHHLERLSLSETNVENPNIKQVAPELKHLYAHGLNLTNEGLSSVCDVESLKFLSLTGAKKVSRWHPLSNLSKLQTLGVEHTGIEGRDIVRLKKLSTLEQIHAEGSNVTDCSIVRHFPQLTQFGLGVETQPIKNLDYIQGLTKLRAFFLNGAQYVGPSELEVVKELKELCALHLINCPQVTCLDFLWHANPLWELWTKGTPVERSELLEHYVRARGAVSVGNLKSNQGWSETDFRDFHGDRLTGSDIPVELSVINQRVNTKYIENMIKWLGECSEEMQIACLTAIKTNCIENGTPQVYEIARARMDGLRDMFNAVEQREREAAEAAEIESN